MTDTSSDPSAGRSQVASESSDPLRSLHKMSRTAGLGNNEYVAVNGFAVAAIVFGLASALVIFNTIFLIVPAVAVVLGVVALYQIRNSNGTQTGRALAWLGILLAIGFSFLLGSSHVMKIWGTREDEKQIANVIVTFGENVHARNYDAAYTLFSDRFTGATTKQAFVERLNLMQNSPNYGAVKSMEWNGQAAFDVEAKSNATIAATVAKVYLDAGGLDRQQVNFIKLGGKWKIDGIPMIFPPQVNLERPANPGKAALIGASIPNLAALAALRPITLSTARARVARLIEPSD